MLLAAMLAMMLIAAAHATAQIVNTGNVANQQGVVHYKSVSHNIELTGSSLGSN